MRVLAGDVGGTKTLLGLFDRTERGLVVAKRARYESAAFPGLAAIVRDFLAGTPPSPIAAAAFAVAGPVARGAARLTNLSWDELSEPGLASALSLSGVRLLNDFAAVAHGIPELRTEQLRVISEAPIDPEGPVAVIGAGTGLGEAIVVPTSDGRRVLATEGGHTDFAPRDETEIDLLRFLRERHERVSVERVVSGPGLAAIYELVVDRRLAPEAAQVRARMEREDPSAVIGELGVARSDAACARALDLFVGLYGAEAGNFALKVLPTGGLFVAGGIAPKILPALTTGAFREAFLAKGRMRPLLERIRASVVLEPDVGLLGAAAVATALG